MSRNLGRASAFQERTTDHREWYRTVYLRSDHWRDLRARKFKANPFCERCGVRALDVHHVNYRHLFDVTLADLLSLCRPCHDEEHRLNGTPKRPQASFEDYFPPAVRAAMREQYRQTHQSGPPLFRYMNAQQRAEDLKRRRAKAFMRRRCPKKDKGPRVRNKSAGRRQANGSK